MRMNFQRDADECFYRKNKKGCFLFIYRFVVSVFFIHSYSKYKLFNF